MFSSYTVNSRFSTSHLHMPDFGSYQPATALQSPMLAMYILSEAVSTVIVRPHAPAVSKEAKCTIAGEFWGAVESWLSSMPWASSKVRGLERMSWSTAVTLTGFMSERSGHAIPTHGENHSRIGDDICDLAAGPALYACKSLSNRRMEDFGEKICHQMTLRVAVAIEDGEHEKIVLDRGVAL